jgi:hypothetical protein
VPVSRVGALERDRTAMAAALHATAGVSFGEQRCFLRAGIEAALTAEGVPLPEGHDRISDIGCLRLRPRATKCKGDVATMLSLVGLCTGNGEARQWAGGKRGVFKDGAPSPRLETFQCCSQCKQYWYKTAGGENHGKHLLRAAEQELTAKLQELGPDGYTTWATQLTAEEVRDLYVRSWKNPLVPPPKTKKRAAAVTLEERPANRQAVPAVVVTVPAPAPAPATTVPEPDIHPSLAEQLQKRIEAAQAAKRQAEEHAAAAQAAKRQAEEQAAAAQAKVDELQKKQQASDTMADMNAESARESARRKQQLLEAEKQRLEKEKRRLKKDAKNYETLCSIAIQHDPEYIDIVDADKRTYALCMQAVTTPSESDSGIYIEYVPVKHRTLELCMAAVQHDGIFALEHVPIQHRSDAVCTKAVQWAVDLWHECGATKFSSSGGKASLLGESLRYAFKHLIPVESKVALLDLIPGDMKAMGFV